MSCAVAVAVLLCTPYKETSLELNGFSFHDHKGYNGINWGLGLEKPLSDKTSVSVGWYENSINRTSLYASIRYSGYNHRDWDLGVRAGLVTGYRWSVAPVLIPELCYKNLCAVYMPDIKFTNTNVIGFHIKVPLNYLTK